MWQALRAQLFIATVGSRCTAELDSHAPTYPSNARLKRNDRHARQRHCHARHIQLLGRTPSTDHSQPSATAAYTPP